MLDTRGGGTLNARRPSQGAPARAPPAMGFGAVAQMGERCNRTAEVSGSIPLGSTSIQGLSRLPSHRDRAVPAQSQPPIASRPPHLLPLRATRIRRAAMSGGRRRGSISMIGPGTRWSGWSGSAASRAGSSPTPMSAATSRPAARAGSGRSAGPVRSPFGPARRGSGETDRSARGPIRCGNGRGTKTTPHERFLDYR